MDIIKGFFKTPKLKPSSYTELYTNGVYEVLGHTQIVRGELMLIGDCTKTEHTAVKRVGADVFWPVFNRGTNEQQFKTIKQLRNEKINNLIDEL